MGSSPLRATKKDSLVVCAGQRIDPGCAKIIQDYHSHREGSRCRFVMQEWIDPDQLRSAELVWVLDAAVSRDCVESALEAGIALLVPAQHVELKNLCETVRCGLSYPDAEDALRCLDHLLREDGLRSRMAANGYDHWRAVRAGS